MNIFSKADKEYMALADKLEARGALAGTLYPMRARRRLVISSDARIDFLLDLGCMPLLVGKDPYRVLKEYAEYAPYRDKAKALIEQSEVVLDLRGGGALFVETDPLPGRKGGVSYVGPIPREQAETLLAVQAHYSLKRALRRILEDGAKGRLKGRASLSVEQIKQLISRLSCGNEELSFDTIDDEIVVVDGRGRSSPDSICTGGWLGYVDYRLSPGSDSGIRKRSDAIWRLDALADIWVSALRAAWASGAIEPAGSSWREIWYIDYAAGTWLLDGALKEMAGASGVGAMVDAYYDGVPIEDIVA